MRETLCEIHLEGLPVACLVQYQFYVICHRDRIFITFIQYFTSQNECYEIMKK